MPPRVNQLGLKRTEYRGKPSTLCPGCGHDSISNQLITMAYELGLEQHKIIKVSGIGCSSKTPAYFLGGSHGFNALHGRMPSVVTGALLANTDLACIAVSGDGDTGSIGMGQFKHVIRRNVPFVYIIENNGVYGLTKGQFSASADVGSTAKRGQVNREHPIDSVLLSLNLGAGFVARSFSGDKEQLVPIIQAGLRHRGFALIDIISPCVTFNDHRGSTKSYQYTRDNYNQLVYADFVPPAEEIATSFEAGDVRSVAMHDGSRIAFRKVPEDYDPTDRDQVYSYIRGRQQAGEVATGLLYVEPAPREATDAVDFHGIHGTVDKPLSSYPFEALCPGADALEKLQKRFR